MEPRTNFMWGFFLDFESLDTTFPRINQIIPNWKNLLQPTFCSQERSQNYSKTYFLQINLKLQEKEGWKSVYNLLPGFSFLSWVPPVAWRGLQIWYSWGPIQLLSTWPLSTRTDLSTCKKSSDQHCSLPPKPVYQPAKKQWSTWLHSSPNRSINLQKSSDQHGFLPSKPVYQPEKKHWSTWAPFRPNRFINLQKKLWSTWPPSTKTGLSTCKKAVINRAPFHPSQSINLQKNSDQHGSLPPKPVYQPAKKQWSTGPPSTQAGLSTCKKTVINMATFHPNRSINLQKSSDQHGSLPPKSVYQPA